MPLRFRRRMFWHYPGAGYWYHGYGYPGYSPGPCTPPPPPWWCGRRGDEEAKEDLTDYVAALKEELGAAEKRLKELEKGA